jgi:hypothetical protein
MTPLPLPEMLTPKCRPRDFRVSAREIATKNRVLASVCEKFASLAMTNDYSISMAKSGCAGSPEPTCLSLQFGEMQGDFAKLQGLRRRIQAEGPRISMGWIGLSLIQGAGRTIIP